MYRNQFKRILKGLFNTRHSRRHELLRAVAIETLERRFLLAVGTPPTFMIGVWQQREGANNITMQTWIGRHVNTYFEQPECAPGATTTDFWTTQAEKEGLWVVRPPRRIAYTSTTFSGQYSFENTCKDGTPGVTPAVEHRDANGHPSVGNPTAAQLFAPGRGPGDIWDPANDVIAHHNILGFLQLDEWNGKYTYWCRDQYHCPLDRWDAATGFKNLQTPPGYPADGYPTDPNPPHAPTKGPSTGTPFYAEDTANWMQDLYDAWSGYKNAQGSPIPVFFNFQGNKMTNTEYALRDFYNSLADANGKLKVANVAGEDFYPINERGNPSVHPVYDEQGNPLTDSTPQHHPYSVGDAWIDRALTSDRTSTGNAHYAPGGASVLLNTPGMKFEAIRKGVAGSSWLGYDNSPYFNQQRNFAIIEVYNQSGSLLQGSDGRIPTLAEIRGEIWDAIIRGANGIVYFAGAGGDATIHNSEDEPNSQDGSGCLQKNTCVAAPGIHEELTRQDQRIKDFDAALVSTQRQDESQVGVGDSPKFVIDTSTDPRDQLQAAWRSAGGKQYFIVENMSHSPLNNVKFKLDGLGYGTVVGVNRDDGNDTTIGVGRDDYITDSFGPYETSIYYTGVTQTGGVAVPPVVNKVAMENVNGDCCIWKYRGGDDRTVHIPGTKKLFFDVGVDDGGGTLEMYVRGVSGGHWEPWPAAPFATRGLTAPQTSLRFVQRFLKGDLPEEVSFKQVENGQRSGRSLIFTIRDPEENEPLAPSVVVIEGVGDSGSVEGNGAYTNDSTLVLHGFGDPRTTVVLERQDIGEIGTTQVDATGRWTFDYSGTNLASGTYTFTGHTQYDQEYNGSESVPFVVHVGTVNLPAAEITSVGTLSGPLASGNATSATTWTFSGTALAGSSVNLRRDDLENPVAQIQADVNGNWTYPYDATGLIDEKYDFRVEAVNTAVQNNSPVFRVVLDRAAPELSRTFATVNRAVGGLLNLRLSFSEAVSNVNISDLVLQRDTVPLTADDLTVNSDDDWMWTISGIQALTADDGEYTLRYYGNGVRDAAGNSSDVGYGYGPSYGDILYRFYVFNDDNNGNNFVLQDDGTGALQLLRNGDAVKTFASNIRPVDKVIINGFSGDDTLAITAPESLLPHDGVFFRGGSGTDSVQLQDTTGNDEIEFSDEGISFQGSKAKSVGFDTDVEHYSLTATGGADEVAVSSGVLDLSVTNPWSSGTFLTVDGATVNANSDLGSNMAVVIGEEGLGGVLNLSSNQNLSSLTNSGGLINGSGKNVTLSGPFSQSDGATDLGQLSGRNFTLSGGTLTTTKTTVLNGSAAGTFTQSGGTHTISAGDLLVGSSTGTYGATYTLSAGDLNTRTTYVGQTGSGTFNQSGGIHTASTSLIVGYSSGSSGTYTLSGGTLNGAYETIGASGTGSFTQSGTSTHTVSGLIIGSSATGSYTLSGGSLTGGTGSSLSVGPYSTGTFAQSGGTVSFPTMYMSYACGTSTYNLSSGSLSISGSEYEGLAQGYGYGYGCGGSATFNQSGGTHSVTSSLYVGGYYDNGGTTTYNLSAGTLTSGQTYVGYGHSGHFDQTASGSGTHNSSLIEIDTFGIYDYRSGDIYSNVSLYGNGTLNVRGGGTRTVHGSGLSYGYIKTWGTTLTFTGGFYDGGSYLSDPADNYFTDVTLATTGVLRGWIGDRFFVSGDLISESVQNLLWETTRSELLFDKGSAHRMSVTGQDQGDGGDGYLNNFAWGVLALGSGQSLELLDAYYSGTAALYVNELRLADGISQIKSINSNGVNIYYNPNNSANNYLGGLTYKLEGGGVLAPSVIKLAGAPTYSDEEVLSGSAEAPAVFSSTRSVAEEQKASDDFAAYEQKLALYLPSDQTADAQFSQEPIAN